MRQGLTRTLFPLLALWVVPTLIAGDGFSLPDDRLGTRTAPLLLLSRPDVQSDLQLTTAQSTEAQRTIDDLRLKAESLRGKGNAPETVAARRAIDEAQARWLQTALTPEQQARLVQIDLQWEGPAALVTRPSFAAELGLSTTQTDTLRRAHAECQVHRDGTTSKEADRLLAERALGVLNETQRARWRSMLGRPFAVRTASQARPVPTR